MYLPGKYTLGVNLPSRLTKHMFCINHAQYFISFINILKPTFCSLNTPNLEGETIYDSHLFTFALFSRVLPDRARRHTHSMFKILVTCVSLVIFRATLQHQ